jgi:CDP-glycerol glycerophosphotransferase (TagB/SpsB family)
MINKVRKNQISCYMNHGIPLKATKGYIQVFENTDYVLSPSRNMDEVIEEQFGATREQLVLCGEPRTDVLFDPEIKENLRQFLHLERYRKMVLWTPTFRTYSAYSRKDSARDFPFGLPLLATEEDVKRLKEYLAERNLLLVIKPHIHQELSELVIEESPFIRVVKQDVLEQLQANVYDLMKLSDAMLTDYSSIGFDYLLLNRPIGYSIDDIKDYRIGFSVPDPLEFMPGIHMENVDDLLEFLEATAEERDTFEELRLERKKYLFAHPDGRNGARLLDILKL